MGHWPEFCFKCFPTKLLFHDGSHLGEFLAHKRLPEIAAYKIIINGLDEAR